MEYHNFEKDFVNRTIRIIDELSDETEYEVTLLINCLFGLIVIPTEKHINRSFNEYKAYIVNQIRQKGHINKESDDLKLFRCMKNALSHLNIKVVSENGVIASVKFCDRLRGDSDYHTEITFSVNELKVYSIEIANYYLDNYFKLINGNNIVRR